MFNLSLNFILWKPSCNKHIYYPFALASAFSFPWCNATAMTSYCIQRSISSPRRLWEEEIDRSHFLSEEDTSLIHSGLLLSGNLYGSGQEGMQQCRSRFQFGVLRESEHRPGIGSRGQVPDSQSISSSRRPRHRNGGCHGAVSDTAESIFFFHPTS